MGIDVFTSHTFVLAEAHTELGAILVLTEKDGPMMGNEKRMDLYVL